MESFFNTIYYYTNGFYGTNLDTYLYATYPGYLHIGLFTGISALIFSAIFYFIFVPVRRKIFWWLMYACFSALANFLFSLWYTLTPLINNQVSEGAKWTYLDCTMMGISDIIWTFVFFFIFSMIMKCFSAAKYVPF